jgi:two-component system sensor histidine kinase DesK
MRLLPHDRENGWAPYIWLAYFGFFFLDPILNHAGWKVWLATALGTLAFLCLYFAIFWLRRPWDLVDLGMMLLLGVAFAPWNGGATCFFIYAAALLPFVVERESVALRLLGVIVAVAVWTRWAFHLSGWFLFYSVGMASVICVGNIYFAQRTRMYKKLRLAQDEIEHLAKVAERERIARDLHDVLGHTLSVIILKSELASKLIDRDPERAKSEIRDVEQTSREALAEVRSTIRGYRQQGLEEEMKRAKATLETAGVNVKSQSTAIGLSPAQESVVAMVVREAVTNVVRHAGARNCELRLAPQNGSCVLEIQDDGHGTTQPEGNGLRGMRERIEALGGTVVRETTAGTKLTIRFPLVSAKESGCK